MQIGATAPILFMLSGLVFVSAEAKELTRDEKAVLEVIQTWESAFADRKTEALEKLVTEDVEFHSRYLGGTFRSKASLLDAIRKKFAEEKSGFVSQSSSISAFEMSLSGEEAHAQVTLDLEARSPTQRGPWRSSVKREFRLKRDGENWKIFLFK